jgi:hypothetical protein
MLTRQHDGEVVAAARAITRTLESEALDIHALAERLSRQTELRNFPKPMRWKFINAGFVRVVMTPKQNAATDARGHLAATSFSPESITNLSGAMRRAPRWNGC